MHDDDDDDVVILMKYVVATVRMYSYTVILKIKYTPKYFILSHIF